MLDKVRKIGMRDYEITDYKFPSTASKRCRKRLVKALRSREKRCVSSLTAEYVERVTPMEVYVG